MSLDPAREWLAAGITGLQRQREWDVVATVSDDGAADADVQFVALPDGSFVVETENADVDPGPFAHALTNIDTPYRALAVRRSDVWAVGAVRIEVARLDADPGGSDLALTWNGSQHALTIDGRPAEPSRAAALERLAVARVAGAYAARAHRLRDDLWELSILAL